MTPIDTNGNFYCWNNSQNNVILSETYLSYCIHVFGIAKPMGQVESYNIMSTRTTTIFFFFAFVHF